MDRPAPLGLIAGNGIYPLLIARAARRQGVSAIHVAAFMGETKAELAELADSISWMRVGQLGRLLKFFEKAGVSQAIMAGQIAPKNLFDLRPDFKALLIIGSLKEKNAETLFGAVANELSKIGVDLLPATTYLEEALAPLGVICGPTPKKRVLQDIAFGFQIAKEVSRLDIGQTVVVRNGTVLAVEAFEGTNDAVRRGGALCRGGAVMVKVSKPKQDFRFDVPVIGCETVEVAVSSGINVIAVEAQKTLLLDLEAVKTLAVQNQVTIYGHTEQALS